MGIVYSIGVILWLCYGFIIQNNVILITNSFSLLFGLTLLFLKLKYNNRKEFHPHDIFKDSKPLTSEMYEALTKALNQESKSKPTLKNRL